MNKKKKKTPTKATSRNSVKPSLKVASKNTRSAKPKTKVFGSKVIPQQKKKRNKTEKRRQEK